MTRARMPLSTDMAERLAAVEDATKAHANACRKAEKTHAADAAATAEQDRTRQALVAAVHALEGRDGPTAEG